MDWKELLNSLRKNWIVSSALMILFGLMLVLFPQVVMLNLCYLISGIAIALGVVRIVSYFRQDHTYPFLFQTDLILGFLILGLGLFALLNPETMMSLIPIVLGVLLIGCGVGNILRAVDARKAGVPLWGLLLGLAIATVILGWVIVCNPFATLIVAASVIGAGLIYEGVTDIVIVLLVGKKIQSWRTDAGKDVL